MFLIFSIHFRQLYTVVIRNFLNVVSEFKDYIHCYKVAFYLNYFSYKDIYIKPDNTTFATI